MHGRQEAQTRRSQSLQAAEKAMHMKIKKVMSGFINYAIVLPWINKECLLENTIKQTHLL